jgi:hypothetical protein
MNPNDPSFDRLFAEARLHQPFGESSSFGFEARLRTALATATPGFTEIVASLSWRFAAASLPIALAAFVFLAMQHQYILPDGVGGLVTQWAGFLPLPI